ncbi:MAG: restriction endonuclease subunit S [Lewinellaceae bacterium]|nr:restriction endonuclease subunit S [Lewinellaceae bacterium]
MVCIGGSIGKSVLVDRDVSCNQQINTITPVIALSDYLHYGMQATFFQTSLLEKASGSATPIINKGKWERLPFPLAPLPEQRRIVQKVNHLFRQIDALAAGAEQAEGVRRRLRAALLHRLEQAPGRAAAGRAWAQLEEQFGMVLRRVEDVQALRQSILQLAVKGLLVEQDPDLPAPQANKYWVYVIKCSNDSNYIGQTGNLRKRWRAHLNGEGADWTKRYPPQYLLYWEVFDSREEAVNKEKWLKTGFGRKWIKREEAANRLWRAGEPAWVLLERIKEEKARLVEEGKIRKQKALPAVAEEEMPFEAPEGWVWCRLGDIMHNLQTGPFGSSLPKSEYVENGIPVINPKSIKNEKITPIPKMAISEKTLKRLISFKLNEGDIIMARRGEMGRCALITKIESGWLCGTGSLVITLPKEIFKPYFVKFLGSHYVKTYLLNASVGSTMNNLNQRILLNLPFPLPPLAEQRRIVERVEGLLGWCERLEAAMGEREEKEGRLVRAGLRVDMYP